MTTDSSNNNSNNKDEDTYDGPFFNRRIEWKCPDRKRHTVVVFGSWNSFKGGNELEYQGKQLFAVTLQLPLGNYVYRFLVDQEDWETNNGAPKTAKNGEEYNQIHITEGDSDSEEEDEEDGDENNATGADGGGNTNTTLVLSDNGQLTIGGNKRRGRPSMELDLGANFEDGEGDDEDEDEDDALDEEDEDGDEEDADDNDNGNNKVAAEAENQTTNGAVNETNTISGAGANANTGTAAAAATSKGKKHKKHGHKKGKKHRKGHRKGKKGTRGSRKKGGGGGGGGGEQMAEKEWARYVFVQQLRQQQQHNDEINRVKTLWKQERQVRVEMHKKVLKQMKQCKKDLASGQVEIERLQKQAKIGKESDERDSATLRVQNTKLEVKVEKMSEQLKLKEQEFTTYRRERVHTDKQGRESKDEWEGVQRKYKQEISSLKTQIKTINSTNVALQSNLDGLRNSNQKTLLLRATQFDEHSKQWEDEKNEFVRKLQEMQKLTTRISTLENELLSAKNGLSASNKRNSLLADESQLLTEQTNKLKQDLYELRNSNEATEKIQHQVAKAKSEFEANNRILQERLSTLEKQLSEQKHFYEKQANDIQEQHSQETAALKANSDKQMNELVERLRQNIQSLEAQRQQTSERLNELESQISASDIEKQQMTVNLETCNEQLESLKLLFEEKRVAFDELNQNSISAGNSAERLISEKDDRISDLEKSLADEKESGQSKFSLKLREIETLQENVHRLSESLNEKSELNATLSIEMTSLTSRVNELEICENTLKENVIQLENQLAEEQNTRGNNKLVYEQQIEELHVEMNSRISDKDEQIVKLESEMNKIESELNTKLQEFNHAATTIQELNANIEADRQQFTNERREFESSLVVYQEKDDRIHNCCKTLFEKFTGIRDEMKSIKETQIQQLEELHKFFGEFSPLLSKVFAFNQSMIDDLLTKYKRELSQRRKYFNLVQDLRGNIRVFCRVRPLLGFEIAKNLGTCVKFPVEGAIIVADGKGGHKFEFDQVYVPETSQTQVSEDTTEYIQSVMDGYNVSIFAYGQTGSGKTYTMEGPPENPGVNLRALSHLFKLAEQRAPQFQYNIKVSIFEVYNENIVDLIETARPVPKKSKNKAKAAAAAAAAKKAKSRQKFKIRHLPDGGVEVMDLTWITVKSDSDVLALNKIAKKHRKMASTEMNADSSRSHMLLVVDVQGINIPANIQYFGKLYLVDLAGSERVKKSGVVGVALKEAAAINKSLSALGDVMQALQRKEKFIPYRNSTLTDLMSNALGGNAKTIMFINCCPTETHAFETMSSLKFAERVGKVELGQAKKHVNKKKKLKV